MPTGMGVFDVTGDVIEMKFLNDGYYQMIQSKKDSRLEYMGTGVTLAVHPDDRAGLLKEAHESIAQKRLFRYKFRVISESKSYVWIGILANHHRISDSTERFYASYYNVDELIEAEASREQLYQMYQTAVEDAKLVVWEYDIVNHRVIMAENEFTQYDYRKFGLKKIIENAPQSLVPYIDDDSVESFLEMYRKIDSGAKTASCEVWYKLTGNNEPRCERIRYVTVFDGKGRPVKAYGMGQNITAQKLDQEKYTSLYKQITATLSEAVSSTQLNLTKNTYISGYSADPKIAQRLERDTADEHFATAASAVADENIKQELLSIFTCGNLIKFFKNGRTQIVKEYPVRTSKGTIVWISTTVYLLQNPDTGDIEALTYAKDITKFRKDEEIIRHLSKEGCDFIGIIDTESLSFEMHNGVWDCSILKQGEVKAFDDCRASLAETFIAPDEREAFLKATDLAKIREVLASEPGCTVSYTLIDKGTERKKQLRFSLLDTTEKGILVVQNDITESSRKEQERIVRLQEALLEAEKANSAKSEFVSRISHDIRTPISIISSMTSFAQQDIDDKKKLTDDLRKIEASNTFLLSLINDVLDISKIDSGKIELHPEPYVYDDYVSNIRNMFEPLCKQKNITFVMSKEPVVDVLSVDRTRLNQITLNLVSNAVKYTPAGGTVTFYAHGKTTDGGKVLCTVGVQDTGIGMSSEFQKTMFDPFTQEYDNPGRDKTIVGTGLGLSIVKKIVDLMGGTISVKSERGKGTDICITFTTDAVSRKKQLDDEAEKTQKPVNKDLSGLLLLAEDNIMNTEIAERILDSMGFAVDHAENGKRAVELFSASKPGTYRAILMDIQMPLMNGYEATQHIRELDRSDANSVPIIAMTADAFSAAIEHSKEVGMTDYVTKPISPQRLRDVLEKSFSKNQ